MRKTAILFLFIVLGFSSELWSQVYLTENFNTNVSGWTSDFYPNYSGSYPACEGTSSYVYNLYNNYYSVFAEMESPTQIATGSDISVSFTYKVVDYSSGTGTTGDWGNIIISYTLDGGVTYTEIDTIDQTNHTPSDNCTQHSLTIPGTTVVSGSDFGIKIEANHNNGDYYVYIDEFSMIEQVSCLVPTGFTVSYLSSDSLFVTWTPGGTETSWNVTFDTTGYALSQASIINVNGTPEFGVGGLTENTSYTIYIQSNCGSDSSIWYGPFEITTYCLPFAGLGWCEGFDSGSSSEDCWTVIDGNNDGDTWNLNYTSNPYSGNQSAMLYTDYNYGDNDDWLITPNVILTGNEVLEFHYRVQSSGEPNDFEVLLSTTGTSATDFQDTLMALDSYNNTTYADTAINLSAYTGNVFIAFHVPSGGLDGWRLYIDQVCVEQCLPSPGTDGTMDVCSESGLVNLNDVIVAGEPNGDWDYSNPSLIVNDSLFDVSYITGVFDVNYIVTTACVSDTTFAQIHVYNTSSAGEDGTISICRNEPVNLLSGLQGYVDMNGTWYDPGYVALPDGQINASNIPAQYNYSYITGNGVCPDDTSNVLVTVLSTCDYLDVEEMYFGSMELHPNPTTGVVYISNNGSSDVYSYSVTDAQGRVVANSADAINGTSTTSIDLSDKVKGIYMIRVYNNNAEKVFRVVVQ